MKRALFVVAVGLLMGADDKKESDQLQGTWTISSLVAPEAPPDIKGSYTFSKGDVIIRLNDGRDHKGVFTLDPSKSPKEINITPEEGPNTGKVMKGIYSIVDKELTMCIALPDKDRPKSLEAKPESRSYRVTLTRGNK